MAAITISASETGQPTLSKTFTLSDANMDLMVQAYQQDANIAVNGTATRAQVFNTIVTGWAEEIKTKVIAFQTVPAVVPPPIPITSS